jgi:hypothetical protein
MIQEALAGSFRPCPYRVAIQSGPEAIAVRWLDQGANRPRDDDLSVCRTSERVQPFATIRSDP